MSRNIISAIETNVRHRGTPANPRLDTVYRLALALRVPPGALLPEVGQLVSPDPSSNRAGAAVDLAWPE
ncbi:helix-turn-helix domain-containing protein [Dietzia aurantiaca]|nr:helix-turn-helix domain-containing protein [Dietzia aurantiaca]